MASRPRSHNTLYPVNGSGLIGLVLLALFWNAIAFALVFATASELPGELSRGNYGILVVYIFPLIGVGLIVWVIRFWQHQRRFGKTALIMDPFPGAIGGQVGGEILIPLELPADTVYRVSVQCLHSKEERTQKGGRKISTLPTWYEEMEGRVETAAGQVRVRFLFDVPADLPVPTPKGKQWHHWQLGVDAKVPGVDLDVRFELPMHKSSQASSVPLPGLARERQRQRSEQLVQLLDADQQGDTLYFDLPYGRGLGGATILLFTGVVFFGAGLIVRLQEPDALPTLVALAFILVGGGMLAAAAYIPGNRLQVAIEPDCVHVRRYWLGWKVTDQQLAIASLRGLAMEQRSTVTNGKRPILYYRIVVVTDAGKKWTIAESLPGRSLAEEAMAFLQTHTPLNQIKSTGDL